MTCTSTARRPQLAFSPTRSRAPSRAAANYTLGVVAFDASGNRSAQSTVMVATTDCPDTTPPGAPAAQRLVGATQTSLTMGWSASTDNVGVTGYDVYRNGTKIATTGSSATSYTYTALTCNTTYTVGLVAFDAAGNRSNLAQASLGHVDFCLLRKPRWRECLPQPLGERFSGVHLGEPVQDGGAWVR